MAPTRDLGSADGERLRNRALASQRRVRIMDALRREHLGLGARDLAVALDLHLSTVRFHLRALEEAGLVRRRTERSGRPGRPRISYLPVAARGPSEAESRYLQLSRSLAASLVDAVEDPARVARDAGRAWGRRAAEERGPSPGRDPEETMRALADLLDDLGFAPEIETAGRAISLRRCPFREVAEEIPEVVCSVHRGLMGGALSHWRAPIRLDDLDPFVEPDRCLALFSDETMGPESS
ncbi:MAG: helix-turn-helix domain-containing protein [Actinomycetota bacterium]